MKSNKQCFYLVAHKDNDFEIVMDKVFLQKYDAIKWGRTLATKNPTYLVYLYKQEITRNGILEFVSTLDPFLTPEIALELASDYNLEAEVKEAMDSGMSPYEACKEWDLI